MKVVPMTIKSAKTFVGHYHHHNGIPVGALFAIGLLSGPDLVGCAIIGRPVARALQDGVTAEVIRCCVLEDAPKGACSKLYSHCQRAWFAMGGLRLVTYTLNTESGASLRGAGWKVAARVKPDPIGWDRNGRPRTNHPIYQQGKLRWEVAA